MEIRYQRVACGGRGREWGLECIEVLAWLRVLRVVYLPK